MRQHAQRLLLVSAAILASQVSTAHAEGYNSNPWSPSYEPQRAQPYPAPQAMPQHQYRQPPQYRPPQYQPQNAPQARSGNPWNNAAPAPHHPMMQQGRPPMGGQFTPPAMNRQGPGNFPPPPPPGWTPGNAPSAFYTPGYNPRNDRWSNNNKFWGQSGPSRWMNPNKRNLEQGWDDMLNAPSRMGDMPGGWSAPSVSMPNPIDIGDQFQDNIQDLPDQIRNMDVGN